MLVPPGIPLEEASIVGGSSEPFPWSLVEGDAAHIRLTRARRSRLEPFRRLADSIMEHWDGIISFLETRVTNGVMEAINGLLQLAKRMARGFRSIRHFRIMALLKAGRLCLQLPSLLPT